MGDKSRDAGRFVPYRKVMAKMSVGLVPEYEEPGVYVERGYPRVMGSAACPYGYRGELRAGWVDDLSAWGEARAVGRGQFTVFSAGSHRLTEVAESSQVIWLVMPLAWYMQWQFPKRITRWLLQGRWCCSRRTTWSRPWMKMMLCRWAADMGKADADVRRIVMLEVEARLLGSRDGSAGNAAEPSADDATGSHAERLAGAFMAKHYREDLSVKRIAGGRRPAPQLRDAALSKRCGMGLWEYLTRLRIGPCPAAASNHRLEGPPDRDGERLQVARPAGSDEAFAKVGGYAARVPRSA